MTLVSITYQQELARNDSKLPFNDTISLAYKKTLTLAGELHEKNHYSMLS